MVHSRLDDSKYQFLNTVLLMIPLPALVSHIERLPLLMTIPWPQSARFNTFYVVFSEIVITDFSLKFYLIDHPCMKIKKNINSYLNESIKCFLIIFPVFLTCVIQHVSFIVSE